MFFDGKNLYCKLLPGLPSIKAWWCSNEEALAQVATFFFTPVLAFPTCNMSIIVAHWLLKIHLQHLFLDLFIDSWHPKEKRWLCLDQSLKHNDLKS